MKNTVNRCSVVLGIVCVLGALNPIPLGAQSTSWGEEFVGPLAGWKNAKTDYGAVGDGQADDTAAIQRAFDDLRLHAQSNVLYFPAGTYRITKTVGTRRESHTDCMGIAIVGEDPATTSIRWDGPAGGTMVLYDAWYSRISRLTLDGVGKAATALVYGGRFSTYNETSDMVFQDAGDGMLMGNGDSGQAENEVLRCVFLRCSGAGIRTNNFNSLDIWAWYCRFEDCGYGLLNGAGNFHAHQCVFLRSKHMDIGSANLMTFSFVNNFSRGSKCFMDWAGGHSWGSATSIIGNRIIDPTGQFAIRLGNGGPYLLADNVIRSRAGNDQPPVILTWGDQTLLGNTYSVDNPVKKNGRYRLLTEKVVPPEKIDAAVPVLLPTPPKVDRAVFEVATGASAADIQLAIDRAARLSGNRPVVHLPKGAYPIDRSLVIPAAADVQLIGDGAAETATVLRWSGPPDGVMLKLEGPSHATLRDINLHIGRGTVVRLEDCDQVGGRIFADQLSVNGISTSQKGIGVRVDGVEQSDVLFRCLQGGGCGVWVQVVGGPNRRAGKVTPGQVSVLTGATSTSDRQYLVEKGGRMVVRAVYHEVSGEQPQAMSLADCGAVSIDATRFSFRTSATMPLFSLDAFRGDFTLLTSLLLPVGSSATARIETTGDGSQCNVLAMNDLFWVNQPGVAAGKLLRNQSRPMASAALLLCNMNSGKYLPGGFATLANLGQADDQFILKMTSLLRQCRVWVPEDRAPAERTDVRLRRLILSSGTGGCCLDLRAQQPVSAGP
jgi:hypothetical protein